MQSLHDFIIELKEPLKDTFVAEGGTTFFGNKDFSTDRLSNRIAKVISTPLFYDTKIKAGDEVLFEPTILYKQTYQGLKQGFQSLIDSKQMHFKLTPNMIICYRTDSNESWKGHGNNNLLKPIKNNETPLVVSGLIIPENAKGPKYKKDRMHIIYTNESMSNEGVKSNDEVIVDPTMTGVLFWLDGVEYRWLRNVDIWGKVG